MANSREDESGDWFSKGIRIVQVAGGIGALVMLWLLGNAAVTDYSISDSGPGPFTAVFLCLFGGVIWTFGPLQWNGKWEWGSAAPIVFFFAVATTGVYLLLRFGSLARPYSLVVLAIIAWIASFGWLVWADTIEFDNGRRENAQSNKKRKIGFLHWVASALLVIASAIWYFSRKS